MAAFVVKVCLAKMNPRVQVEAFAAASTAEAASVFSRGEGV